MPTPDVGHQLTDKQLAALERRIAKLYRGAGDELQETIDAYFEQFAERDKEMKSLVGSVINGKEWTEQDYKQWRLNQLARGERYIALRDKLAKRMTDANAVAISYVNDQTPGIYSLNRNYGAYTIEQVAGNVGFDLWDEETVKRLMVEQPGLMPYYPPKRALQRGIDLAWGKKQITASITSSILQGKSIKNIADDLQKRITTMSRDSAIRTARTAVTGAQNAGRMDSYAAAEKMGIKLKKEWLATLDARTRYSHAELDGEQVEQDKKFSNGCRFPGDPQGPPWEIYNCRCTLIAAVEGVDTSLAQRRARNPATGQTEVISNMTYAEWAGWKKPLQKPALNAFGEEIVFAKTILDDNRFSGSVSIIKQLSMQYNTKLKEVRTGSQKSAGSVQISGTIMNLASKGQDTAIHEFAHTISMENQTKFGLYDENDFWKAIRKEWRLYKKDTGDNTSKWISVYEHGANSADEFMAEAFTLATLDEYGIDVPEKYGGGLKYAKRVLEIVKRYFAK